MIIPFTWAHTTLSSLRAGDRVNLECDMVGKYVARSMELAARSGLDKMTTKDTSLRIAKGARRRGPFAPIEEAVEAIRAGRMVVVVDDEDRENEGDLTMAASKVTPEAINFMARHGRGSHLPGDGARAARPARDSARGQR